MKKKIVADILLISVVLFTAFAARFFWQGGGEGVWVVAEQDGREILRVPLAQDGDYLLSDEEYGRNMLRIENGAVRVLEADCPRELCVKQGEIRHAGQSVVCLPHHLVVRIEGAGSGVDLVSG